VEVYAANSCWNVGAHIERDFGMYLVADLAGVLGTEGGVGLVGIQRDDEVGKVDVLECSKGRNGKENGEETDGTHRNIVRSYEGAYTTRRPLGRAL
jgi:hypothetical protein